MVASKAALSNISSAKVAYQGGYNNASGRYVQNPYTQNVNGRDEDISWLLR
jgi:hypothetical protein